MKIKIKHGIEKDLNLNPPRYFIWNNDILEDACFTLWGAKRKFKRLIKIEKENSIFYDENGEVL